MGNQKTQNLLKNIENFFQKFHKENELPDYIYHSTPYENLPSILKKLQLYMTDFKDIKNEYEHFIRSLKKLVAEKEFPKHIMYDGTELTKFWQSLELYMNKNIKCYRMSFCLDRDNKYVREIFAKKNGATIKFSTKLFNSSGKLSPNLEDNIVGTKICYEDGTKPTDKLKELADFISIVLNELTIENQSDVLIDVYSRIIPNLPRFLTSESDLEREEECRCYRFYDDSSPKPPIVKLFNKDGVYSPKISPNCILEIILHMDDANNFSAKKSELQQLFKDEFPGGEFNHIKITQY